MRREAVTTADLSVFWPVNRCIRQAGDVHNGLAEGIFTSQTRNGAQSRSEQSDIDRRCDVNP